MHRILGLISWAIRQFILPNPFTPLGDIAVGFNWLFGCILIPITFVMVGLIYERNSDPAVGSILFFVVYLINAGATYLVCLAYPRVWLMVLIGIGYLLLYGFATVKIREHLG